MTTAHRPTYNFALGGNEQGGNRIIVPTRQYSAKDMPGEQNMKRRPDFEIPKNENKKLNMLEEDEKIIENPFPQDQDEESFFSSSDQENNSLLDSSEEFNLQKEFEKIKKEKEEEKKKKQEQQQNLNEIFNQQELLKNNPLLQNNDYSIKKRWYEDTVFKNQARKEIKEPKKFINDAVRTKFHRKFLHKYCIGN